MYVPNAVKIIIKYAKPLSCVLFLIDLNRKNNPSMENNANIEQVKSSCLKFLSPDMFLGKLFVSTSGPIPLARMCSGKV